MKKKQELFEKKVFDDYGYAIAIKEEAEVRLEKIKKGMIIAAVATVINVIGIMGMDTMGVVGDISLIMILLGVCGSIASYIFGGGIMIAVKWIFKLARIGWYIIPIWVVDLMGLMFGALAGVGFFLFTPIIFVYMNYRQVKGDYNDAEMYLSHFKTIEE